MSKGIKCFLVDTQEDKKIRLLKARWPVFGKYVWIELLTEIYGVEGYYMDADDESLELFAGKIGVQPQKVKDIVRSCLEVDLFDMEQYEETMILTSAAIQRSYMQYFRRSKEVSMEGCFLCSNFDVNAYKNLRIVNNTGKNVSKNDTISFHSLHSISSLYIDKDGVVQEQKKEEEEDDSARIIDYRKAFIPDIQDVKEFIGLKGLSVSAEEFMKYYEDRDWTDNNGQIVKNWKSKLLMWDTNKRTWKRPVEKGKVDMPQYMIDQESGIVHEKKKASATQIKDLKKKQQQMKY